MFKNAVKATVQGVNMVEFVNASNVIIIFNKIIIIHLIP